MNALVNVLIWPGKIFARQKYPLICFAIFSGTMIFLGLQIPQNATIIFAILFYFCISISFLNHLIQKEKNNIIEGFIHEQDSKLQPFFDRMHSFFLFFAQLCLLWTVTLLLRELSSWGKFFDPDNISIWDWSIYSLDLIIKAVLFDIPEIYHFNLIEIEHIGFWGSTAVFIARLIILVLILGSVIRWREIRVNLRNTIGILDKHPQVAETKILLILKMHAHLFPLLKKYAYQKWSPNVLSKLLETLGKSQNKNVLPILEHYLTSKNAIIQRASLLGMAYLGHGDIKKIENLLKENPDDRLIKQALHTLSCWNTKASIQFLANYITIEHQEPIRHTAIEYLGETEPCYASSYLVSVMLDTEYDKIGRFAAQKALVQQRKIPPDQFSILADNLQNSNRESNRRFAAMSLGQIHNIESLPLLLKTIEHDSDDDTRGYCAKGVGYLAQLVYQNHSIFDKNIWQAAYGTIKKVIMEDNYDVAQVMAIRSLRNIIKLISLGLDGVDDVKDVLEHALSSSSLKVTDAVDDVLDSIISCLEEQEGYKKLAQNLDLLNDNREYIEPSVMECDNYERTPTSQRFKLKISDHDTQELLGISDFGSELSSPNKGENVSSKISNPSTHFTSPSISSKQINNVAEQDIFHVDFLDEKYTLQKELYKGKYTEVILVLDKESNTQKVLKRLMSNNPKLKRAFLHEIEILQSLNHEKVISILEKNVDECYFTMPYIKSSLHHMIKQKKHDQKEWTQEEFINIMEDIFEVLNYIHQQQIFHCDIKPANLLYDNKIILCDFGAARSKFLESNEQFTMGTPPYMAPEQIYNKNISEKTDIYAVGIIAYEILSNVPYSGINKPLFEMRPNIPSKIQDILVKATASRAKNRYKNIDEFWNDCKTI